MNEFPEIQLQRPVTPDLRALAILLLLAALIYLPNLGRIGFEGKDELRYAQIAKEIGPGADLILLHYGGRRYYDKPPIFFWMVKLSYLITGGISPLGLRLPSALSAIVGLLITYFLALRCFGRRAALFAALFLLASGRYFWSARWSRLDMPLCLFIFLALFFFVRGYHERPRTRLLDRWGFWVAIALGALTKGPPAFIPLLVAVAFLSIRRDWDALRNMAPIRGILLTVALVFLWVGPALWLDPSILHGTLKREMVERITNPPRHVKPFYYYFGRLTVDFLPGAFFIPGALLLAWRERKNRDNPWLLFHLVWFALVFILFSLIPGKRGQYVLPLFPAAAILVGALVARAFDGSSDYLQRARIPLIIWAASFAVLGLGFWGFAGIVENEFEITLAPPVRILGTIIFLIAASAIFFSLKRSAPHQSIFCLAAFFVLLYLAGDLVVFPNAYSDSDKLAFARRIESRYLPLGPVVAFDFSHFNPQYTIYGPMIETLDGEDTLAAYLKQQRLAFVVMTEKQSKNLQPAYPELLHPVEQLRLDNDIVTLFQNQPSTSTLHLVPS